MSSTFYGMPYDLLSNHANPTSSSSSTAAASSSTLSDWQEVLSAGPPGGGWLALPSTFAICLASASIILSCLLSLLSALIDVLTSGQILLLLTSILPALISLLLSLICLSIDTSQFRLIGPFARPPAILVIRSLPPLSLCAIRGIVVLVSGAALLQTLPSTNPFSRALQLFAVLGCLNAIGAIALSWKVAYVLLFSVDAAALRAARTAGNEEEGVRSLLESHGCPYNVEGSVALDVDRDGAVGEEDLVRFYGREDVVKGRVLF